MNPYIWRWMESVWTGAVWVCVRRLCLSFCWICLEEGFRRSELGAAVWRRRMWKPTFGERHWISCVLRCNSRYIILRSLGFLLNTICISRQGRRGLTSVGWLDRLGGSHRSGRGTSALLHRSSGPCRSCRPHLGGVGKCWRVPPQWRVCRTLKS